MVGYRFCSSSTGKDDIDIGQWPGGRLRVLVLHMLAESNSLVLSCRISSSSLSESPGDKAPSYLVEAVRLSSLSPNVIRSSATARQLELVSAHRLLAVVRCHMYADRDLSSSEAVFPTGFVDVCASFLHAFAAVCRVVKMNGDSSCCRTPHTSRMI